MSNLLLDFDLALDNLITSQPLEVVGLGATGEMGVGRLGGGGEIGTSSGCSTKKALVMHHFIFVTTKYLGRTG